MTVIKIVIIALGSAICLGLIGGKIISSILKNRAKPGYKPLLSLKEFILCGLSAVVGITLIVVGVFVLPTLNQPETALDPESSELSMNSDAGNSDSKAQGGGSGQVITHNAGASVMIG